MVHLRTGTSSNLRLQLCALFFTSSQRSTIVPTLIVSLICSDSGRSANISMFRYLAHSTPKSSRSSSYEACGSSPSLLTKFRSSSRKVALEKGQSVPPPPSTQRTRSTNSFHTSGLLLNKYKSHPNSTNRRWLPRQYPSGELKQRVNRSKRWSSSQNAGQDNQRWNTPSNRTILLCLFFYLYTETLNFLLLLRFDLRSELRSRLLSLPPRPTTLHTGTNEKIDNRALEVSSSDEYVVDGRRRLGEEMMQWDTLSL